MNQADFGRQFFMAIFSDQVQQCRSAAGDQHGQLIRGRMVCPSVTGLLHFDPHPALEGADYEWLTVVLSAVIDLQCCRQGFGLDEGPVFFDGLSEFRGFGCRSAHEFDRCSRSRPVSAGPGSGAPCREPGLRAGVARSVLSRGRRRSRFLGRRPSRLWPAESHLDIFSVQRHFLLVNVQRDLIRRVPVPPTGHCRRLARAVSSRPASACRRAGPSA